MSFDLSRRNLWEARTDCKLVRILGTAIVGQVLDHDMSREPSAGLGGCTCPMVRPISNTISPATMYGRYPSENGSSLDRAS